MLDKMLCVMSELEAERRMYMTKNWNKLRCNGKQGGALQLERGDRDRMPLGGGWNWRGYSRSGTSFDGGNKKSDALTA